MPLTDEQLQELYNSQQKPTGLTVDTKIVDDRGAITPETLQTLFENQNKALPEADPTNKVHELQIQAYSQAYISAAGQAHKDFKNAFDSAPSNVWLGIR